MSSQLKLAVTSANFAFSDPVTSKNSASVLATIRARAIERWGEEKWLLEIVREYVRLSGDAKATVNNRKTQVQRAFEVGSCSLETAMLLAAAVGCRFQMVCTEVQVMEF